MQFLATRQHTPTLRRRPAQDGTHLNRTISQEKRSVRPVLAEARSIRGDRRLLGALVAALRERARENLGQLKEVHFWDEGDRVGLIVLWRSPTDLRSFVEGAHRDVLAFRAESGAFPEVERTLWWSTAETPITVDEARERTEHLHEHGPGPRAFTLASLVPAPV